MSPVADPVTTAIEIHRRAHEALSRATAALTDPPSDDDRRRVDRLRADVEAAAWALLAEMPPSAEGLLALATYAGDFVSAGHDWPPGWDQRFYATVVGWPGP